MTDPRDVIPVPRRSPRRPPRQPASPRGPRAALALAALALALAGCSADRGVLARVGSETITLARFNQAANGDMRYYEGTPDSAKARLLKDLVDRSLMVQGARREGIEEAPEFRAMRQLLERQILRQTLFERLVGGPFAVSEAEIRELHQRRATVTRARLIFTYDEPSARQVLAELADGADFATLADRHNPPGLVPEGGDIGFVVPGSLLPPLDDVVRVGPLGLVPDPVPGGGEGWFVVRREERRPEPQPPLAEVGEQLGELLRQRKQRIAFLRAVEEIGSEHQVAVVHGAPQSVMARFRVAPGDARSRVEPPGPEERGRVLARYREGVYTLGDAYDDLVNATDNRPDLAVLPTVARWIEAQTIERAVLAEALQRRIHEEPAFQQRIRDRLDDQLLQWYYQRQVGGRVGVGPTDVQAAYERHKASFTRLETARVVSVTLRDSAAAAALADQAGHAPNLREAAVTAGSGGQVREQRLRFPADSPVWTRFESRLQTMNAGDIAGPYSATGGWLIFQLIEKRQSAPPLDALSAGARQQLQGVAVETRREAVLTALTDSLRTVFRPVESHADRLRRVRWPPLSAGSPGS